MGGAVVSIRINVTTNGNCNVQTQQITQGEEEMKVRFSSVAERVCIGYLCSGSRHADVE